MWNCFGLKKKPFTTYVNIPQEEMSGAVSRSIAHKIQPMTSPQPGVPVGEHSVTQWIYSITIIVEHPEWQNSFMLRDKSALR